VKTRIIKSSLHIAGIYLIVASLWILLSDKLALLLAGGYAELAVFQTWKGIFFVAATSILLFFYSRNKITSLVAIQLEREAQASQAYEERGVLLREVHHRVKNNMQLIISLLNIKEDSPDSITDVRNKVSSMAYVHELLYRSPDMASISVADFCAGMAELIQDHYGAPGIHVEGKGESLKMTATLAIPLGIFIAEASSNAIRHGRMDNTKPLHIQLEIQRAGDDLLTTIRDDGIGFASDPTPQSGTAIMEAIAQQLEGRLSRRNDGGALVELACALDVGL